MNHPVTISGWMGRLALLFWLSLSFQNEALAWVGIDLRSGVYVELEADVYVKPGDRVEYYDYRLQDYRLGEVIRVEWRQVVEEGRLGERAFIRVMEESVERVFEME
ncbi:MAG: hypothetical protein HQL52_08995 [Magnetococcales bacterium]|nr:hypothetical protein [Magnetococcales bacterium]